MKMCWSSNASQRSGWRIWMAPKRGQVIKLPRGGLSGWVSDDVLLVSGRESLQRQEQILYRLNLSDDSTTELARADRCAAPRSLRAGNGWCTTAPFPPIPTKMGFGSAHRWQRTPPARPELFGAYQWRGCQEQCTMENDRLIIVPFDPDAVYHEFWELNPSSDIGPAPHRSRPDAIQDRQRRLADFTRWPLCDLC